MGKSSETDTSSMSSVTAVSLPEADSTSKLESSPLPEKQETTIVASASLLETENTGNLVSVSPLETKVVCGVSSASLPDSGNTNWPNVLSSNENQEIPSATPHLLDINSVATERINYDTESGADLSND